MDEDDDDNDGTQFLLLLVVMVGCEAVSVVIVVTSCRDNDIDDLIGDQFFGSFSCCITVIGLSSGRLCVIS